MKLLQCKNVSPSPPHKIHRGLIIKLYLISWWLVAVLGRIQDVVHCFIRYLPSYPPHTVIQHTLLQRSHFSIINNIHFLIFTLVCRHLSEKCILVMGWLWFWFIKCMEEKYDLMCTSSQDIEVPLSFQKNKTGESLERNREIREATPHNTRVPS